MVDEWIQGNIIFRIQQGWCTDSTGLVCDSMLDTCIHSRQIKLQLGEGKVGTKTHPWSRSCLHLIAARRVTISFLHWSDTGCINLTPGSPHALKRWPTQNIFHVGFLFSFVCLCFMFVFCVYFFGHCYDLMFLIFCFVFLVLFWERAWKWVGKE